MACRGSAVRVRLAPSRQTPCAAGVLFVAPAGGSPLPATGTPASATERHEGQATGALAGTIPWRDRRAHHQAPLDPIQRRGYGSGTWLGCRPRAPGDMALRLQHRAPSQQRRDVRERTPHIPESATALSFASRACGAASVSHQELRPARSCLLAGYGLDQAAIWRMAVVNASLGG
jgi:hypothetical protein